MGGRPQPSAKPCNPASLPAWVFPIIVTILILLAYSPAIRGGFIWDDDAYVTENQTLRDPGGLGQIWFHPKALPQYYPLVHTTYWLEYHLWGLNAAGYHLVNVLLHALAAILLGRLLARLQIPGAWLAAAIWALHPVAVESVAWITERKNVLSAVFYFSSALAYLRFSSIGNLARGKPRRALCYAAALALFAAAMLSKTVSCSLPAALLLIVWWKKGHLQWRDAMPLLPFFAIGLGLGLATVWIEKNHVGAQGAEWSLTFPERCLIAGRAVWFYLGKLFWPARLTFIYPRWNIQANAVWQWAFPAMLIAGVTALWFARRRIGRGPLIAALIFIGTLGPALGFINIYPMRYSFVADHFQYIAAAAPIALCAAGLIRIPRPGLGVLLLALAFLTWKQSGIYHNLETLWRDTLAKNPGCWMAHNNLARVLTDKGEFDEAIEHCSVSLQLNPTAIGHFNFAIALTQKGQNDEAVQEYRHAIEMDPHFLEACNNLGVLLASTGKGDEAIDLYRNALQSNPAFGQLHSNWGLVLAARGQLDEAIGHYRKAIESDPRSADAYDYLGVALARQAHNQEAIECFSKALEIDPENTSARAHLESAIHSASGN